MRLFADECRESVFCAEYGQRHGAGRQHLDRYVDEFAFRLNEGNVAHHTMTRLRSLIGATKGKRLTYARLIA